MDTEHDTKNIACVVLYTDKHEFVLQRRTPDAKVAPGKLCMFGGHMQQDEGADEAVKREIHEEVSLHLNGLERIGEARNFTEHDGGNVPVDFHIYAAQVHSHHFKVFEGVGAEWLPADKVLKDPEVLSGTKHAIELFMKEKTWH